MCGLKSIALGLLASAMMGGLVSGSTAESLESDVFSLEPPFRHYLLVVLENEALDKVLKDPYMGTTLPAKGRLLTNYRAVTHPSQPNYIAMVSGSLNRVLTDGDYNVDARSIADTLEERGLTWRTYQEGYPGKCFTGSTFGRYARKHNPFMTFTGISRNATRCANIRPSGDLMKDVNAGNLANYMLYTPDLDNDGHDTTIAYTSAWLKGFLEPLLNHPNMNDTLIFITYDEDDFWQISQQHNKTATRMSFLNFNRVYGLMLGAGIQPGTRDDTIYNHYSQLATLQKHWEMESLHHNDYFATPFDFGLEKKKKVVEVPEPMEDTFTQKLSSRLF